MFKPESIRLIPEKYIKSVQPFAITIAASGTSATQTLNDPVDTSRSVIFFGGSTTADTGAVLEYSMGRAALTNSTTVTVSRNAQEGFSLTVYGTVVEFQPWAVLSVQAGTIAIGSALTSNTATINPVDTTCAVVLYQGLITSSTTNAPTNVFSSVTLTNSTTVTAARNTSGTASLTVGYAVVQFRPGLIKSIQARSVTLATSSTSSTDTITSVNTSNAILLYNGIVTTTTTYSACLYNLQLTNSTTVTLTRSGTATSSRTIVYTVLEFMPGVLNSVQRGTLGFTSGTSTTTTINPVNIRKAVCNWLGFLTNASAQPNQGWMAAELLDATDVEVLVNTGGSTCTAGYEIVEFR